MMGFLKQICSRYQAQYHGTQYYNVQHGYAQYDNKVYATCCIKILCFLVLSAKSNCFYFIPSKG
jgi:hypothetical protein